MAHDHQALAVEAAKRQMARLRLTNIALATDATIDRKTVNDFLSGNRWPRRPSLASISEALGWPADSLELIADRGVIHVGPDAGVDSLRPVGGDVQDASQYVESATGERVASGITNEDLYREILRSRAESDQIAAKVETLSERVARLEQQGP